MQKQKFISKKWFIILAIILLLIPIIAYAAPATPASTASGIFDDVLKNLVGFITQLMRVLQKILWPIMLGIGGLMNNDLLFGAGMEDRLLDVWTFVRNIVNIGFVLILLGIALYNVTGFAKDTYQLKTFLPKLIVAIIAVNFSFIALKFVLDVSNVMTTVVFTLPASISEDLQFTGLLDCKKDTTGKLECKEKTDDKSTKLIDKICISMFGSPADFNRRMEDSAVETKTLPVSEYKKKNKIYCDVAAGSSTYKFTQSGIDFFSKYTSRSAALIMAIQLMNVVDVDSISKAVSTVGTGDSKTTKVDLQKLSFNLIFSLIIYIVYAVAYVVLFVVLLVRVVVLWVLIALSPLMFLKMILLPELKTGDKDLLEEFKNNAFAPLKIGVVLTIGYIMLETLRKVGKSQVPNNISFTDISLETSGISDLQALIIAIGAVAIIWLGVFSIASTTMASSITEAIRSKLGEAGRTLSRTVKLLPIIPAGAGAKGRMSFDQASNVWSAPVRALQARYGKGSIGPVTLNTIKNIKTKTQAEQALRGAIGKPRLEKALGKQISGWNKKKAKDWQKRFYGRVERSIGKPQMRQFTRGRRITAASRTALKGISSAPTAPTATRSTSAAKGGGSKATGTKNQQANTKYRRAQDLGIATATHTQNQQNMVNSSDPEKKKKATDALNNDPTLNAVDASHGQLTTVQNTGKTINGAITGKTDYSAQLPVIENQLKAADQQLRTKGKINDSGKRKEILTQVLKKTLGSNYAAFMQKATGGIKGYVNP